MTQTLFDWIPPIAWLVPPFRKLFGCLALLLIAGGAWGQAVQGAPPSELGPTTIGNSTVGKAEVTEQSSIGVATMTENGTIILDLRAEGPSGILGHTRLNYLPTDKPYAEIVKHLNGLHPGETKSVPPWPDSP